MFFYRKVQGEIFALLTLTAVLVFLFGTTSSPYVTGDEPRYLQYSYAFFKHLSFALNEAEWQELYLNATGIPLSKISADGVVHPVYVGMLLSPVAYLFSIAGLRAISFITGICGVWYLLRYFRDCMDASLPVAVLTGAIAVLTIPVMPHLHLFYMEVYMFTFIAAGWYRIHRASPTLASDFITAAVILSLPFIHLRASVVGAVLYLIFLWHVYQRPDAMHRLPRVGILLGAALAALCVLVALNLIIYGGVAGSVTTARPPQSFDEAFWIVAMQWFNVRHGLMAYAPIWLLGYVGLVAGAFRGDGFAREGLLLVTIAAFTGVGINPGESWPARFWVLSVPMLAVGLCYWLQSIRSVAQWAITIILAGLSLLNTLVYWWDANSFLANRQSTYTYQLLFDSLFDSFGGFHPGLLLPPEIPDLVNWELARNLMLVALALIAVLVLSIVRRPAFAWGVLLVLLIGADIARVRAVPPSDYVISPSTDGFVVSMRRPIGPTAYFQLGPSWEAWSIPPAWPRFTVEVTAAMGGNATWTLSANQVISATCRGGVVRLDVDTRALPAAAEKLAASGVKIYESRSIVRRITTRMTDYCTS